MPLQPSLSATVPPNEVSTCGIHSVLLLKKSMPSSLSLVSLSFIQPPVGVMISTPSGLMVLVSK